MNCNHIASGARPVATVQVLADGVDPRKDRVCARCARKFLEEAARSFGDAQIVVEPIAPEPVQERRSL